MRILAALCFATLALGLCAPQVASAGCHFKIYFTNKSGHDVQIKNLSYKISRWEKLNFGSTFKVKHQKSTVKKVYNIVKSCKTNHKWKFTWRCKVPKKWKDSGGKWSTSQTKVKGKGGRSTILTKIQLNGCYGKYKTITVMK